jgi:hypothetical protein
MQRKIEKTKIKHTLNQIFGIVPRLCYFDGGHLYISKQENISQEHINQIAKLIENTTEITKISFNETYLNNHALEAIAMAIKNKHSLTELAITRPKKLSEDRSEIRTIAELLKENQSITSLDLVNCCIGYQGAEILALALSKNKTLKTLRINVDKMGTQAATRLMEAINIQGVLTCLELYNTGIDDELEEFAKALANNRSLTTLSLPFNYITNKGAIILATHLKKNTSLTQLSFGVFYSNLHENIGQEGIIALERLFKQNYWMDQILIYGHTIKSKKTTEERALQSTRKSPAQSNTGVKISFALLNKFINLSDNSDILIKDYLHHFEEITEDYVLSYADLFKLITTIHDTVKPEYHLLLSHPLLQLLFNEPYLFEIFLSLNKLFLINKNNFKTLYLSSNSERVVLHDLLNEIDINTTELISMEQMKCIEILLPNSKPLLYDLFKKITENISLSKRNLISLLSLSVTNIERMLEAVTYLSKANMLTPDSYEMAFKRITAKLPEIFPSTIEKKSRKEKQHHITHSQVTLNNSLTFFVEHAQDRKYPGGGFGKIKKAYTLNQDPNDTPIYGVKKLFNDENAETYARRNVKYNRLLGRESYFYKRKNLYRIVSPWQCDKSLDQFSNVELLAVPLHTRLKCITNCLSQIEILHSHFRIHGDIKDKNVIMNFATCQMELIDFDGVHKKGSHSSIICTEDFLDRNKAWSGVKTLDFADDVFAMGKTISILVPRLFYKKEIDMTPIEYAISLLASAMKKENHKKRCTIKNALDYCQQLLCLMNDSNTAQFTKEQIKNLAEETIMQDKISIEDVLRGKTQMRMV